MYGKRKTLALVYQEGSRLNPETGRPSAPRTPPLMERPAWKYRYEVASGPWSDAVPEITAEISVRELRISMVDGWVPFTSMSWAY
jgi:hypothetical protein